MYDGFKMGEGIMGYDPLHIQRMKPSQYVHNNYVHVCTPATTNKASGSGLAGCTACTSIQYTCVYYYSICMYVCM